MIYCLSPAKRAIVKESGWRIFLKKLKENWLNEKRIT